MTELERLSAALQPLYTLDRELGRGALGMVFLATTSDGSEAAVKIISRDLVQRMSDPQRFISELERVGRLRHPALVPLLGSGLTADGTLYYAMRYEPGDTGRDRVERDGMLPAADVAALGARIADALAAAHTAGFVHGTIIPANLHFAADGVRLADLGVYAGLVEAGISPPEIARFMGAPQYMSPEQLGPGPIDGRSDIYSLGATLYELLTGRPPFGGRTTSIVMASVLSDEPPTPASSGIQAPGHVASAILRAIEKAPDDRWPSAGAFADALRSTEGAPPEADRETTTGRVPFGCLPLILALAGGTALLHRLIG